MGNDAIWEGSLDNSAEIICVVILSSVNWALRLPRRWFFWSAFEKHSPTDYPTRFPSHPPFQPLSCCHFSVLCIAFLQKRLWSCYSRTVLGCFFFSEIHFVCFRFSKWKVCQELSTKLGALHEVALWRIMVAHNNQHAFRSDCLLMLQMGTKGWGRSWETIFILYTENMMI